MITRHLRAFALGILGALIGFSFALATSQSDPAADARAVVAPRFVGTNLRFSNPFLLPGQDAEFPSGGSVASDPNGYDLGDACFGSMIVRYLTALDGVQPYQFTSTTIGTTGLNLGTAGRVFGVIPSAATTFVKFNATLTDAASKTRTGVFRVGTFTYSPAVFRFAHDRLSDAKVGMDYITNIEVLGGDATTTFSVVPGSLMFNSAAASDMESLGLRLFNDGTIAGRPLKSGTLTFTARAQKSSGPIANNRADTSPDQPLTINIAALDTVESVLGTFTSSIAGNSARPGKDVFTYSAFINDNGLFNRDFAGATFTLRVGGETFTTTLNGAGQSQTGNVHVALAAFSGFLNVTIRNQDFNSIFGALPDGSTKNVVVEIQIGDTFLGTEPVQYSVVNRNGRFRLSYNINRSKQVGGLFQIYALRGDDSFNGTAFLTKFLISQVPDSSNTDFGLANDAVINIGPVFSEDVKLFRGQGFFNPPGIAQVDIQGRRKFGAFITYHLPASQTGITPARDSGGQPQTFLLGVKVTTDTLTFNGAASLKIFPF